MVARRTVHQVIRPGTLRLVTQPPPGGALFRELNPDLPHAGASATARSGKTYARRQALRRDHFRALKINSFELHLCRYEITARQSVGSSTSPPAGPATNRIVCSIEGPCSDPYSPPASPLSSSTTAALSQPGLSPQPLPSRLVPSQHPPAASRGDHVVRGGWLCRQPPARR